jgi:membrane-associated protease RseP (regulator of RpoE activity)
MVRTLTWVLAGVLLYTLIAMALRTQGLIPSYIRVQGPITTVHTKRGRAFLNWLAGPRRFWRAWGNFGVGIALVTMVGMFVTVILTGMQAVNQPEASPVRDPQNVLVIPGVNDFLPMAAAPEIVAGLLVGLVVHEGGHGLLCRVEDIDIESMGLAMLAILPVGAFVEPDEDELLRADRGVQTRMYAAGVTNNFALSFIALLLLFGPVAGSIAVVDGAPVGDSLPGSAANESGIDSGDVITGIDGQPVSNTQDLEATLARNDNRVVEVSRRNGSTVTVERAPMVVRAVQNAPLEVQDTVTGVNDTDVATRQQLNRAARDHPVAELRTESGASVTTPLGAYGRVQAETPLAEAGAPVDEPIIVTSLDGQRTHNATALGRAMSGTAVGDTVTVVGYVDGERRTYEVEMGESDAVEYGVLESRFSVGISGFEVNDFGIDSYPAATFLEFIGGDPADPTSVNDRSFVQRVFIVLALPVIGIAGGFGYNFAGFTGVATEFYTVEGPLAALGDPTVFLLANVLFWTGWINLVIGQFNLVPTFPLDGGHILRATTESVVSRLPVPGRRSLTTAVTLAVTATMILGLLTMIFGPRIFA